MKHLHKGRQFALLLQERPELLLLGLVVMIVGMLVVPLPPLLLDLLIATNLTIALLVLMTSLYVVDLLALSTFPAIVLVTTMFRLALSISSSRLILLHGHAGQIIQTFGQFVIGDNLVVGLVIFLIVTVVQFIVITKGSERVAEVAARFSLDAMPGKQMSIDADFRAGVINVDGVRARRSVLERESQLYGSFDGAMKFIKGDAIASILIIFVNLIGGLTVGVFNNHLSVSESLEIYTMLTVGDALVAQIPALLISLGAGFVVTRVAGSDKNLGQDIAREILSSGTVLWISAILAIVIGILPGFPLPIFLVISALLGVLAFIKQRSASSGNGWTGSGERSRKVQAPPIEDGRSDPVQHGHALVLALPEASKGHSFAEDLGVSLRARVLRELGLLLPEIHVFYRHGQAENTVAIMINGIEAALLNIPFDSVSVKSNADLLRGLGMEPQVLRDYEGQPAEWVAAPVERLQRLGVEVHPAFDELYDQFSTVVLRNCNEFFGIQETKNLLDLLDHKYPELLKEVYRQLPVQKICEILRRLLTEHIAINNMKLILETLSHWAIREKDPLVLVEHVRIGLARYISHAFAPQGRLSVVVLSPEFEEQIRQGIKHTSSGTFLDLVPALANELLDRIELILNEVNAIRRDFVLLASVDVRLYAKKLTESRFAGLRVISFGELTENISIDVVKTV